MPCTPEPRRRRGKIRRGALPAHAICARRSERRARGTIRAAILLAAGICVASSACRGGSSIPAPSPFVRVPKLTVRGTVTYPQRIDLPRTAIVNVDVVDASSTGPSAAALASVRVATAGRQPPFAFTLTVDSADIRPDRAYGVVARIESSGATFFTTSRPIRVLTRGHPDSVVLVIEPAGSVSAPTAEPSPVATLTYECSGDGAPRRLTVRLWADSAALLMPERTVRLATVPLSSFIETAVKYSDGATTFRWRGKSAELTLGSRPSVQCRSD